MEENSSTGEAMAGGWQIWGQPGLQTKKDRLKTKQKRRKWFKAIPSYTEFKINLTYTDMHKLFFNF